MPMLERITLRPARPGEGPLLSAMAFRSKRHWGYSPAFMAACRAELTVSEADLANPARHYHVAESGGAVVGFYALERTPPDHYELEALFVDPKHIGQGIGRALIEHAKAHARRQGARSIRIQGDPNAMSFYLAAGGIQRGTRESASIPGRDLPVFCIPLQ